MPAGRPAFAAENVAGAASADEGSYTAVSKGYWQKDSGGWRYYVDRSTYGFSYVANRVWTVDDKTYLFDASGYWISKQGWNSIRDYQGNVKWRVGRLSSR